MNNSDANNVIDINIVVKGLVQGIGYRPFVARTAERLGISGWVKNTAGIVRVRAIGKEPSVDEFLRELKGGLKEARVESVEISANEVSETEGFRDFVIRESDDSAMEEFPSIPADLSICDKCASEINEANNRRFRHPFNSCTACGPRFSIIEKLPYDRDKITMKKFDMCPICSNEYKALEDRRRHAQTIACRDCGPRLEFALVERGQITEKIFGDEDCLRETASIIRKGGVVAIKDIGGYHLACDPYNTEAVAVLRHMKHRPKKPLAVMFDDIEKIKNCCEVNEQEEKLLVSAVKPIVLLDRKTSEFADNVCMDSPYIGAMLPCNAQQILLAQELGSLVMTSANASGDMMIIDDEVMLNWMLTASDETGVICGVLSNNRPILTPLDDSIYQVVSGRIQNVRRGRGLVPDMIELNNSDIDSTDKELYAVAEHDEKPAEILAMGGDLKATFGLSKANRVVLSQNMADIDEEGTKETYLIELDRMLGLFGSKPQIIVCDKHPGYVSGRMATEIAEKTETKLVSVYHHHAHVASVMAEHGLSEKVLGVAMDGTGYGEDGSVWGGEFLICEKDIFERIGHLRTVVLQGGDAGAKNANNIAAAYLWNYGLLDRASFIDKQSAEVIAAGLKMGINTVKSSSMGRLFDAVSALLGVCGYNSYEGQAPMELQYLAESTKEEWPLTIELIEEDGVLIGDCRKLFEQILEALETGVDRALIARGFTNAVAEYIVSTVEHISKDYGKPSVALSGGTMLNKILLSKTLESLENKGYLVYINEQVPPSDGGLSLGQIYVAREKLKRMSF